jgi:hypothetical protein
MNVVEHGLAVGLGILTGDRLWRMTLGYGNDSVEWVGLYYTGHGLNPAGTLFQHVMVVRLSSCSPKDGPEYADRELNPVGSYFQRLIAA